MYRLVVLFGFLILCGEQEASADWDTDVREARPVTISQVDYLRRFIQQRGSTTLKNLDARVRLSVDEDPIPRAGVSRTATGATIYMSAALNNEMRYFSEIAILAMQSQVARRCWPVYANYLGSMYRAQNEARSTQRALPKPEPPEVYGRRAGPCKGLNALYPFPTNLRAGREFEVASGTGFVYLHELGHLALNHVPVRNSWDTISDRRARECAFRRAASFSRKQEKDADAWAVRKAFDLGIYNLVTPLPLWQFLVQTSSFDQNWEQASTHPSGLHRQTAVMSLFRTEYEKRFGPLSSQWGQVITALAGLARRADQSLPVTLLPCSN